MKFVFKNSAVVISIGFILFVNTRVNIGLDFIYIFLIFI
jgi:hypothetical protein